MRAGAQANVLSEGKPLKSYRVMAAVDRRSIRDEWSIIIIDCCHFNFVCWIVIGSEIICAFGSPRNEMTPRESEADKRKETCRNYHIKEWKSQSFSLMQSHVKGHSGP